MKIITCKEYNVQDMQRWHQRVEEWKKENSNNIIPQVAFVGFRKRNGEFRNNGYVMTYDAGRGSNSGAMWAKTKKELLRKNAQMIVRGY